MKSILTRSGKFSVFFALIVLLSVSAFGQPGSGQIKLRNALDYDGDHKADYTVFRPSNNLWYILKSSGGANPYIFQNFGIANSDYMAPGDFDGDGKGDVSVFRDTDGIWYRLNSTNNTFAAIPWGITGDEPVARDYDGDGKTDLAVVRRTNGAMVWYVLRSSDGGFAAYQFGLSTDYTACGDYDGDGKFDYAVQRPGATATSQATFYVNRSTDNGFTIVNWGLSNDLVVPGDYDGDGKTDFAVVLEGATPTSNLVWYILRSSDNQLFAKTFGITGQDLNAQNDYDGDGKCDISIWRDTNGSFYISRTSDNVESVVQWGSPNDFPVAAYDTH